MSAKVYFNINGCSVEFDNVEEIDGAIEELEGLRGELEHLMEMENKSL